MELIQRQQHILAEDWMLVVFLIILSLASLSRVSMPMQFKRMFTTFMNVRILHQVMREELISRRQNQIFNTCFFLTSGMLVYLFSKSTGWNPVPSVSGNFLFPFFALCIASLYVIKGGIITTIRFAVGADYSLSEYRYNVFLSNRVAGIFLFPFAVAAAYANHNYVQPILTAAFAVVLFFVTYRLVRGVRGAMENGVSGTYIFLYICTLEILPVAVLAALLAHG